MAQLARTTPKRYRGVSYVKPITAAKEAVPVADLADRLAGPQKMRRVGKTWSTRCLLPDHPDRDPSFVVYPATNSWWCFGCLKGGDVVDLYRLAHGYDERDAHVAAGMLLMELGHELPKRPPTWFRKQERQAKIRDELEEIQIRSAHRRLMRLQKPYLEEIEDPVLRREEIQAVWSETEMVARLLVNARKHG